jgi:universal stress protein E
MPAIRRILFAVKDPEAARQPGIVKAIRLAQSFGASLELFHALAAPVILAPPLDGGASIDTLRIRAVERVRARLAKHAAIARKRGVKLGHSATWDYPPHEAIVRRAAQVRADLIVAECHRGSRARRWVMQLTDCELLRASELPVLLLRSPRPYRRPVVLAAIDPSHAHAKPARLDADILAAATQFSVALHGRLHTLYAKHPPLGLLALGDPGMDARTLANAHAALERQGREAFERFMTARDVAPVCRHLVNGPPAREIPAVARRTGAELVVMGAVSRSGLRRVFIGSTAERVLDALPCDVLVIRPRGTRTQVAPREQGMRVVRAPATPLVA